MKRAAIENKGDPWFGHCRKGSRHITTNGVIAKKKSPKDLGFLSLLADNSRQGATSKTA